MRAFLPLHKLYKKRLDFKLLPSFSSYVPTNIVFYLRSSLNKTFCFYLSTRHRNSPSKLLNIVCAVYSKQNNRTVQQPLFNKLFTLLLTKASQSFFQLCDVKTSAWEHKHLGEISHLSRAWTSLFGFRKEYSAQAARGKHFLCPIANSAWYRPCSSSSRVVFLMFA